jgi:hypothetical protein
VATRRLLAFAAFPVPAILALAVRAVPVARAALPPETTDHE